MFNDISLTAPPVVFGETLPHPTSQRSRSASRRWASNDKALTPSPDAPQLEGESSYTATASLRERLETRHNKAVLEFQCRMRDENELLNQDQLRIVSDLQKELAKSHQRTVRTLDLEAKAIQEHRSTLEEFRKNLAQSSPGMLGPPLTDAYHNAKDLDFVLPRQRMVAERKRILELATWVRMEYTKRDELITKKIDSLDGAEAQRRSDTHEELQELMATMAQTSYCSVVAAHVTAQKVLHHVNEQLVSNHLACRTLSSQLRRREVLKLAQYNARSAELYTSLLENMANSSSCWARSLLQSKVFRRPTPRLAVVARINEIAHTTLQEANQFLRSLGVTVQSLRDPPPPLEDLPRTTEDPRKRLRPPTAEELSAKQKEIEEAERRQQPTCSLVLLEQPLHGSTPAGWLRDYCGHVTQPVFPTDPSEVVDEWRMKATVVIRNCLANIVSLIEDIKKEEDERIESARALQKALEEELHWIFIPLPPSTIVRNEEDGEATPEGSADSAELYFFTKASLSEKPDSLDTPFEPLIIVNQTQRTKHLEESRVFIEPTISALAQECSWFHSTVEAGLRRCHREFQDTILVTYQSVIRQFEKATEALASVVEETTGHSRDLYRSQDEHRKDFQDRLVMLEEDFEEISKKLMHAASIPTAHELFMQGTALLDTIRSTYTHYHREFSDELQLIEDEAVSQTQQMYRVMTRKLGVESVEETEQRLREEREKRITNLVLAYVQEQTHGRRGGGRGRLAKNVGASTHDTSNTSESAEGFPVSSNAAQLIELCQDSSNPNLPLPLATQLQELEQEMAIKEANTSSFPVLFVPLPSESCAAIHPAPSLPPRAAEEMKEYQCFNVVQPLRFIEEVMVEPVREADSAAPSRRRGGKRGGKGSASTRASSARSNNSSRKVRRSQSAQGDGLSKRTAGSSEAGLDEEEGSLVTVSQEFLDAYTPLFAESIAQPNCFIQPDAVVQWKEVLRIEVLQWLLFAQFENLHSVRTYVQRCSSKAEANLNSLLRHHRRRPAMFQADVYEVRLRELENKAIQSEKYCGRLMDRVGKLESMLELLRHDPQQAQEDKKTLKELKEIEQKTGEASSRHVLQLLERQYSARQAHFINSYTARTQRVLEVTEKQQELIESEVAHYLSERAKQLATEECGCSSIDEAVEKDVLSRRVRSIAQQLRERVQSVREFAECAKENRAKRMEEGKAAFMQLHQRSMEEMKLLNGIQESIGRVKLLVQTTIQRSRGEEERLMASVREVEEVLQHPEPRPRVEEVLRALFASPAQHCTGEKENRPRGDLSGTTGSAGSFRLSPHDRRQTWMGKAGSGEWPLPAVEELPTDIEETLREELDGKLCMVKVQSRRQMLLSPAAELLNVLSQLRVQLYTRGASLSVLQWAVELLRLNPENFIEPRVLPPREGTDASLTAGSSSSGGSSGKRRALKGRSNTSSASFNFFAVDPLPPVTAMDFTVQKAAQVAKEEVRAALEAHLERFPGPLLRPSPLLMMASTEEQLWEALDKLCEAPLQRFAEHHRAAVFAFHECVQRLLVCVQLVPQFLSAALLSLSSASLVERIRRVVETSDAFYARSSLLQRHHQRLVKVALASRCHEEKLEQLHAAEMRRQEHTQSITLWLWGTALKEMQEEIGFHAARCINTTQTFFSIFKGLTSPSHLIPCEVKLIVGHHRGLKHLLRAREKAIRLQNIADLNGAEDANSTGDQKKSSAAGSHHANKHTPIPDAVPVFKAEVRGKGEASAAGGSKGEGSSPSGSTQRGETGGNKIALDANGNVSVPVPQFTEIEYPGMAIYRFQPLEAFNAQYPASATSPPAGAKLYFPLPVTDLDSQPSHSLSSPNHPNKRSSAGGTSRRAAGAGSKNSGSVLEAAVDEAELLSPPIVGPLTRMHQQAVLFAGETLEAMTRLGEGGVTDANLAFKSIMEREVQWAQAWKLTHTRLKDHRPAGVVLRSTVSPRAAGRSSVTPSKPATAKGPHHVPPIGSV